MRSKSRSIMEKYGACIMPPILAALVLSLLYAAGGLYPFGQNTLSWCDMDQQALPLLLDWKAILQGKGNMLFNVQNAGGMSFWGVYFFFLSNPLSLLALVFDNARMPLLMNLLVALKMILCASSAGGCLSRFYPKLTITQCSALSLMYAFSGYALLYYQSIMWLDVMAMFPLLLLAARVLIKNGRFVPYTLCLALIVALNYYIAVMVLLFTLLAFGLYGFIYRDRPDLRGVIARVGLATALALGATAFIWLPSFAQIMASARTSEPLYEQIIGIGLFGPMATKTPILLLTAITLPALVLFVFYERTHPSPRGRLMLSLAFIMVLCTVIEPINRLWHTGSYQAFPIRYGYIVVFLVLLLAAHLICAYGRGTPKASKKTTLAAFVTLAVTVGAVLLAALFPLATKRSSYNPGLWIEADYLAILCVSIGMMMLCYGLLLFFFEKRHLSNRAFSWLLLLFVCVECLYNAGLFISNSSEPITSYQRVIIMEGKIPSDGMTRVKYEHKYYHANMTGALGYPSWSHYTSLTRQDTLFTMKKLGFSCYWMEINSNGGTIFTDSLIGNRTIVTGASDTAHGGGNVYDDGYFKAYDNPYCLPLGFVVRGNIADNAFLPQLPRMALQQYLYETLIAPEQTLVRHYAADAITNIDAVFAGRVTLKPRSSTEDASLTYHIDVQDKQTLYFDAFDALSNAVSEPINNSFTVFVNGQQIAKRYPSAYDNGLIELGTFEQERVEIVVELLKEVELASFGVAGIRHEAMQALLTVNSADVTLEGNRVTINAIVEPGTPSYLFLSLPYQQGFSATNNGRSVQVMRVADGFIGIPLEEGENSITLTYEPPLLWLSVLISLFALIAFMLFAWLVRRVGIIPLLERTLNIGFRVCFFAMLLLVFVLPIVFYLLTPFQ